jgi:biopolymer transport protein ExbD
MLDNPNLIIVVETHRDAQYGLMVDVLDELKLAEATRISLKPLEEE